MHDREEYGAAKGRVEEYIEDVGDRFERIEFVPPETDEDEPVPHPRESAEKFVAIRDARASYYVQTHTTNDYFQVVYPYSIKNALASNLDEKTAKEYVGGALGNDADIRKEAAVAFLNQLDNGQMQNLRQELYVRLNTARTTASITGDDDTVHGFNVYRRIFPYRDSFDVKDFNDAVRETTNTGLKGRVLVEKALPLQQFIDAETLEDTPQSDTGGSSPAFQ